MTKDLQKTLIFAGVALVLAGAAFLTNLSTYRSPEEFTKDQGLAFFPDFKDPREAKALEVIDYDAETGRGAIPFKVQFDKTKGWVIPSHNDYPADAKDRLAKTAAGIIDLKKDVLVSDDPDMHEELGVIDPLDAKATSLKGRGKRVTLEDENGKVLADLIVGKPVPGRSGQRYVRLPQANLQNQNNPWNWKRTYAVNVNVDLTARFSDWIETNLLKLDSFKLSKVTIDNHKVDPDAPPGQEITRGEVVTLERKNSSDPWTIQPPPEADKELDTGKVSTLTSALGDLKIVGVRPKPEGLSASLKAAEEGGLKLSRASILSLASRGFYMTRDGQLLSNQGDIYVASDDGVLYILRFGEITVATGEALTAGSKDEDTAKKDESKKDEPKKDETKKDEKKTTTSDNRFLFVMAQFEPELIKKPAALDKPADAKPELPDHPFARTAEETKADEDKAKRDKEDYDKKIEDGKKKVKELTDRFSGWYYVVPGDAFRNIVLDRASLIKVKGATTTPPPGNAGFPGGPGGPGGFPPGMSLPPGIQ